MPKGIIFTITLGISLIPALVYAQTCCSGGVPISGNLGLPLGSAGTWQLSLNYDINVLNTLKEEDKVLDDDSRQRVTQSMLFQTGFSISSRLSADLFLSYVKQERTINQFGRTDYVATAGIGDAALLLKYSFSDPANDKIVLTLAGGPKMPTGRSDFAREDGIPLNADLQPGSGAWDGIFWANGIYKFDFRPSFNISLTSIYSHKGKNNNYLGNEVYQFGNELQGILAFNDNLLIGKKILDLSLIFRFRRALRDRFNEFIMPNTGGDWLFITPALAYNLSQNLAINTYAEIPVYGKVEGTQLSPSYRINAGLFLKINKKNEILKL